MFSKFNSMTTHFRFVMTAGALAVLLAASSCGDGNDGPTDPDIDVDALKSSAVLDFSNPAVFNKVGVETFDNGLGKGFNFNQSAAGPTCGGESSYLGAPDFDAIWEDGFTVATWVTFSENRSFERIIDFGNGTGDNGGLNITLSREGETSNLALTSWIPDVDADMNKSTEAGGGRLIADDVIVNGQQQFVLATIGPDGVMKIYVNGQNVASKANGHPVANVARTSNYVGRSNWCSLDMDFKGTMSAMYVFNKVLSDKEIKALYQNDVAEL